MQHNIYPHDRYAKSKLAILSLIEAQLKQFMIFLVGVSRAGKTTLAEALVEEVTKGKAGRAVYFECPPKTTAVFTMKPFLIEYLISLGDPFTTAPSSYHRKSLGELLMLIEERIRQQKVKLVVVDEADLFVAVRSDAQTYENLQFLKSLMNRTGVPHLFVGTEVLTKLISLDGQVVNRSHVLYLQPYDFRREKDKMILLQVLKSFSNELPLKLAPSLWQNPSVLFDETKGLVGALSELLIKASFMGLGFGKTEIDEKLIRQVLASDPDDVRSFEISSLKSHISDSKKRVHEGVQSSLERAKNPSKKILIKPGNRKDKIDRTGLAV